MIAHLWSQALQACKEMKPDPDGKDAGYNDPNSRVKRRATMGEVISLLSSSSEDVSDDEDDATVSEEVDALFNSDDGDGGDGVDGGEAKERDAE